MPNTIIKTRGVAETVMIFKRLFTNKIELQVSHSSDFIIESATPDVRAYPKPGNELPQPTTLRSGFVLTIQCDEIWPL